MMGTASAQRFTDTLLSAIRLERHLGTRVLISTQEPTISSKLLDLCSITIVHRFSSPEWLSFLKSHIAAAGQEGKMDLMARIVGLNCGQAFVFAPGGLMTAQEVKKHEDGEGEGKDGSAVEMLCEKTKPMMEGIEKKMDEMKVSGGGWGHPKMEKMCLRYMKVKIRKRVTADGGMSLLAIN